MTPLLANAQIPAPSSLEMAGWLACFVAFIAGVNQVLKFTDRFKSKPPTEQLQSSQDALSGRIGSVEENLRSFQERSQEEIAHYHEQGEERRRAIYCKLDEMKESVKEDMDGITKEFKRDFGGVHQRIDAVMEKLAELRGAFNRSIQP